MHNPLYANVEINEQWLLDEENDDHDIYDGFNKHESSINIDSTEVVMVVNVNIESANDINSPDLTIISTEVDMNVDVNSVCLMYHFHE